jgi:hypothetical protein
MSTPKSTTLSVRGTVIRITPEKGGDYVCLTDIAFEFASWISVEFKLYLIKEFQRLKDEENDRLKLEWNLQRMLAKINYRIHTDAIRETLIPPAVTKAQAAAAAGEDGTPVAFLSR